MPAILVSVVIVAGAAAPETRFLYKDYRNLRYLKETNGSLLRFFLGTAASVTVLQDTVRTIKEFALQVEFFLTFLSG